MPAIHTLADLREALDDACAEYTNTAENRLDCKWLIARANLALLKIHGSYVEVLDSRVRLLESKLRHGM